MPTALITGANRGMGLEMVRQYAAEGWAVHAAARKPDAAADLAVLDGHITVHKLDITDTDQVDALAETLKGESIDLLVNNAGLNIDNNSGLGEIDTDDWIEMLKVNAIGPLRLAEAFMPHVGLAQRGVMGFMSSRSASITDNIRGGRYKYRTSKSALNSVVRSLAIDLIPKGIICIALHPGWVRTDMGGAAATLDAPTSVRCLRELFERLEPNDTGHFLNYDGTRLPW
jgi:NAD(P)-dependent dehydrogenase (short-subunit alcohol dehydrogenase family)